MIECKKKGISDLDRLAWLITELNNRYELQQQLIASIRKHNIQLSRLVEDLNIRVHELEIEVGT